MYDEFYSVNEKLKTIFLESNNQSQHDFYMAVTVYRLV